MKWTVFCCVLLHSLTTECDTHPVITQFLHTENTAVWSLVNCHFKGGSRHRWTGRPPLTKSRGWSWLGEAVCFRQGGKLLCKSLTLSPSFVRKWTKGFQLQWVCTSDLHQPPWSIHTPRPDHTGGSRPLLQTFDSELVLVDWRAMAFTSQHCLVLLQRVIFNIVNFSKTKSLYRDGMSPMVKSTSRPKW